MFFKTKTIRDKENLEFIRSLPCVKCGWASEASHLRKGTDGAMGKKPSDCFVLPLCHEHHAESHRVGEVTFWKGKTEIAKQYALLLYEVKGDFMAGIRIAHKLHGEIWG